MTLHDTLLLERWLSAKPETVFAAWADIEARKVWSDPADVKTAVYVEASFTEGGRDLIHCGPEGEAGFVIDARYVEIVRAQRIIFVETIRLNRNLQSTALITVEFEAKNDGTQLKLTDQIVSVSGTDIIKGNRAGYSAALENLALYLSEERITQ